MFYISTFAGQGINFVSRLVWNVIIEILISLALILIIDSNIDPCLLAVVYTLARKLVENNTYQVTSVIFFHF